MKKRWFGIGAALIGVLVAPMVALAAVDEVVTFPKSETHRGTYYAAGQTVVIDGTIEGDLVCAAQTVTVNGVVNGDVICAGQNITVNGPVSGSVRVAGQTVNVNGAVTRNVTGAGQAIAIGKDGKVGGDVALGGETVSVYGPVAHDASIGAGVFNLGAQVGGGVFAGLTTLNMGGDGRVVGDLTYYSEKSVPVDRGRVGGQVNFHETTTTKENQGGAGAWVASALYWLSGMIVLALAFALVAPAGLRRVGQEMLAHPWAAFGWGALAVLAGPLVLIVIALSFVGLPLAGVLFGVWLLALCTAFIPVSYVVGQKLLEMRANKTKGQDGLVLAVLIGVVMVVAAGWVPVLGPISATAVAFWGIGGMILGLVPAPKKAE